MKIEFQHLTLTVGGKEILTDATTTIEQNEQWAFIGSSGSGKTILAKAIAKKTFFRGTIQFYDRTNQLFEPTIELIEQQHLFKNKSNVAQFYYQQRFNTADAEDTITVEEELADSPQKEVVYWIEKFKIASILHKPLLQLSNGENKRLQLVKALAKNPDLIILDNPFIGLDTEGRNSLHESLNKAVDEGKKIILISSPQVLPSCITNVALLNNGNIQPSRIEDFSSQSIQQKTIQLPPKILSQFKYNNDYLFEYAVRMKNVSIFYNEHTILNNIDWEVKKGERWCVRGYNGSGKSTLVSLITADNPQAFANELYIFDRKKGSGESIWEIKKNIGFVSPELHLFFDKGFTAQEVIASGLFDTIGLFKKLSTDEIATVTAWMDLLEISTLKDNYLYQLSLGEQRLVMLARALVKSPPLLILDEPCQGLDPSQTSFFKHLIDAICEQSTTTLIYISHFNEDIPSCIQHRLELIKGNIKT
jgi:molybdate transport system ATP-binding protein